MDEIQKLNVHASIKDDKVMCECGCDRFMQSANLVKVIPPIIGADPILYPVPQSMDFMCINCGKPARAKEVKTAKELETGEVKSGMVIG